MNQSLQVDKIEMKMLLREEKEEKCRLELQLWAIEEAVEEFKRNDQILQEEHVELRRLLQEVKEEEKIL